MVKRPIIMICFLGFVVYKSESTKDLKFLSTTPTTNGNSKTSMSTYWGKWWTNERDSSIRLMVKKWTWWNTLRIASCLQDYIYWRRCQTLYQRQEGICACKLLKLYITIFHWFLPEHIFWKVGTKSLHLFKFWLVLSL